MDIEQGYDNTNKKDLTITSILIASIKLRRKKKAFNIFFCTIPRDTQAASFVRKLRILGSHKSRGNGSAVARGLASEVVTVTDVTRFHRLCFGGITARAPEHPGSIV